METATIWTIITDAVSLVVVALCLALIGICGIYCSGKKKSQLRGYERFVETVDPNEYEVEQSHSRNVLERVVQCAWTPKVEPRVGFLFDLVLLLFRALSFTFGLLSLVYFILSFYQNRKDSPHFLLFASHISFVLFIAYYFCQTILGFFYLLYRCCSKRSKLSMWSDDHSSFERKVNEEQPQETNVVIDVCAGIMELMGHANQASSLLVSGVFWFVLVPRGEMDWKNYGQFAIHGGNVLFNLVEFLIHDHRTKLLHIPAVVLVVPLYLLLLTVGGHLKLYKIPYSLLDPLKTNLVVLFHLSCIFGMLIVVAAYVVANKIKNKLFKCCRDYKDNIELHLDL